MSFAMLFYADEDIYYFNELSAKTQKDAVDEALKYIDSGHFAHHDGAFHFEIIELYSRQSYNTQDYQEFFDKRAEEERKKHAAQTERQEREMWDRLKKKFGDDMSKV